MRGSIPFAAMAPGPGAWRAWSGWKRRTAKLETQRSKPHKWDILRPSGRLLFRVIPMRMEKLTSRFQQALADAQSLAVGRDNNMLEPVHLMAALLDQQGGSTVPLLAQAGVNVPSLRTRIGQAIDKLPKVAGQEGNINVSNDLTRLLNLTDKLAQQRGDAFVASELFVLAALDDKGEVGQALKAAGANKANLEAAIEKMRGGEKVENENAEDQRQAL